MPTAVAPAQSNQGWQPSRPEWMVDGLAVQVLNGSETLAVVGESYHQDALWLAAGCEQTSSRVRIDCLAILVPEPDNPFDSGAVSVWLGGLHVGYLSRDNAALYLPGLKKLLSAGPVGMRGSIVGGGFDDDVAKLGVFLDHDPADFGLAAPREPAVREPRTGLTTAFATDREDDSYDLSWYHQLPADTRQAIDQLRHLLVSDTDPIDRHFMFSELENRLYYLREVEPDSLLRYDETCAIHDSEMDSIRAALVAKFDKVPLLNTYKQQCIRQKKSKNWAEGQRWAERGIALYGPAALSQDWVDDLTKRLSYFMQKKDTECARSSVAK